MIERPAGEGVGPDVDGGAGLSEGRRAVSTVAQEQPGQVVRWTINSIIGVAAAAGRLKVDNILAAGLTAGVPIAGVRPTSAERTAATARTTGRRLVKLKTRRFTN